MNTIQALQDLESGALTYVGRANDMRYDSERGLMVYQSFYIYPDGRVIALDCCDGSYSVIELTGEAYEIFRALYAEYFKP
jgi:hypothetical protein